MDTNLIDQLAIKLATHSEKLLRGIELWTPILRALEDAGFDMYTPPPASPDEILLVGDSITFNSKWRVFAAHDYLLTISLILSVGLHVDQPTGPGVRGHVPAWGLQVCCEQDESGPPRKHGCMWLSREEQPDTPRITLQELMDYSGRHSCVEGVDLEKFAVNFATQLSDEMGA